MFPPLAEQRDAGLLVGQAGAPEDEHEASDDRQDRQRFRGRRLRPRKKVTRGCTAKASKDVSASGV